MTIEQAIEKAIEGGWKYPFSEESHGSESNIEFIGMISTPLFWQALGKAIGWDFGKSEDGADSVTVRYHRGNIIPNWHYYWLSFIDTLAEGKSPVDFFATL